MTTREMVRADIMPVPIITTEQLNRRGACLDQIALFRQHFGCSAIITVEKAVSVAELFDFAWAIGELLFEQHGKEVMKTIIKRCEPPPDDIHWSDGETLLLQAYAEEFARKYIAVYPCVP